MDNAIIKTEAKRFKEDNWGQEDESENEDDDIVFGLSNEVFVLSLNEGMKLDNKTGDEPLGHKGFVFILDE